MASQKLHIFTLLALISLCLSCCSCEAAQKQPVIGILSTPSDFHGLYDPQEFSYIKGSYAEFLEAAGAIPIAIPWDLPERDLISVLDSVNGVLFTGGDASLWEFDIHANDVVFTNFTRRAAFILRYAMHLNDQGVHYPLYGICQGHEIIVMGLVGKPHVIDNYWHPGQLDTVEIIPEGRTSRMFSNMPDELAELIKNRRSTFYNHRYGFNTSLLHENDLLGNFFKLTAIGADDNGKEFIAGLEANDYPIYTVQYHPERVLSEWNNKTQFHHPDEVAQAMIVQSLFLVDEARKNDQTFKSEQALERFLLKNHEHVYFNTTWPKTFFYDKKSPINYHVNPEWQDLGHLDEYDCDNHDCQFISVDL